MGEKLDKYRNDNIDKLIVGFCLDLKFRQEFFENSFKDFVEFLNSNSEFLKSIDLHTFSQGIENILEIFMNYTDLIYNDVDIDEKYCTFHKDFY